MARKTKLKADASLTALQKSYPKVDPDLLASLLSEIDQRQQSQLDELHSTLATLSSPSDDMQSISSVLEHASLTSSGSLSDPLNDSSSSPATASSSGSSLASFSTPLGFLQNLFPHLPSSTLQSNLDERGVDNLDQIVESLLSYDYIRELGESDIDRQGSLSPASDPVAEWAAVAKKSPKAEPSIARQKSKPKKQATMIIGDVRHRHLTPLRAKSLNYPIPSIDPWNYIDSLATRLNAILPNVSTTIFSSAFHNPVYPTPAEALRATLTSLGCTNTVDDFALAALLGLLDAGPDDIPDANLCLRATASEPNDAYHLFEILREIDERLPVIIHSNVPAPISPLLPSSTTRAPVAPPDTPPIPQVRQQSITPSSPIAPVSPAKSVWGSVPIKSKAKIPVYSNSSPIPGSSGWSSSGQAVGQEHTGTNENNTAACLDEAAYWQEKRHTALRQASELYTRQKHEHGREGALYYSQRAQEYAAKEKEWRMKAAKAGVKARQEQSPHKALDLHGLTVNQSIEVVREGVNAWWNSAGSGSTPATPLQIITGQGRHSKGNVPVIGPAVMKHLEREGWSARKREGTVYVTGVTSKR